MKTKKGSFGYAKKRSLKQLLFTLLSLVSAVSIYLLGFYIAKTNKNLLSVVAVLLMVPTAKLMVSSVMAINARKFAATPNFYEKVKKGLSSFDTYAFDLYLTSNDKNYGIPFIFARKESLIGFMPQSKNKTSDAEEHINLYMKKNSIQGIQVKIFDNEIKFLERYNQLIDSKQEFKEEDNELKAIDLMLNLSL